MNFIMNVVKGIMIGVANVIPGVSGGTMAVSLGIYDRLIGSISGLFKNLWDSLSFLFPIAVGCAVGIAGFSYSIQYLLTKHTFVTGMAFIGLILGGLPLLYQALKKKREEAGSALGPFAVLVFLLAFAVAVGMPMLKADGQTMTAIAVTPVNMFLLFLIGIIASATMVVPGVSGSMMLMILGYYYGIIGAVTDLLDALRAMDFAAMKNGLLLLVPFGIGVLIGIFLIAKLITFLFDRYGVHTYCAILGLVLASPFAILYNTGLLSKLASQSVWTVLLGILLMAAGAAATNLIGER